MFVISKTMMITNNDLCIGKDKDSLICNKICDNNNKYFNNYTQEMFDKSVL